METEITILLLQVRIKRRRSTSEATELWCLEENDRIYTRKVYSEPKSHKKSLALSSSSTSS